MQPPIATAAVWRAREEPLRLIHYGKISIAKRCAPLRRWGSGQMHYGNTRWRAKRSPQSWALGQSAKQKYCARKSRAVRGVIRAAGRLLIRPSALEWLRALTLQMKGKQRSVNRLRRLG
jgi:hypothetical protein